MTKGQFALIIVCLLVFAVAIALLITAPCLGYSNVVEMFKAWFSAKPATPPIEDVTETTSMIVNLLRI